MNEIVPEEYSVKKSAINEIEGLFKNKSVFKSTIIRFGGLFCYNIQPRNIKKTENIKGCINFTQKVNCIEIIKNIIEKTA